MARCFGLATLPFTATPAEGYKVGFGRAAILDTNRRDVLYVYDLASGVRRDWPAPPGLYWSYVLYGGPDEVAATARELRAQSDSVLQIVEIESLDVGG